MKLTVVRILLSVLLLGPALWTLPGGGRELGSLVDVLALIISPAVALWVLSGLAQPALPMRRLPFFVMGSIALTALLLWAHREAGLAWDGALHWVLAEYAVLALLGAVAVWRVRPRANKQDAWLLGATVLVGLIVLAPVWGNCRLMMGAHGLWHTASGLQTLERVPPENPVFAGRRAYLYWGYDLFIIEMAHALGRTTAGAALLLNVVALWPLVVAVYEVAALLFTGPPWPWLAALASVGGVNGFGFGWLLLRLLAGRASLAEYVFTDRLNVLALTLGWTSCSVPLEGWGEVGGGGLGITCFVAAVTLLLKTPRERAGWWPALIVALCVAGGVLLHPTSGAMVVPLALVFALLWAAFRSPAPFVPNGLWLLASVVGGMAIGAAHMRELGGAFQESTMGLVTSAAPLPGRLWDLAGPWVWAWPFAVPGLVVLLRRREPVAYLVCIGAVLLALCALVVRLPYENHYKFVQLLSPFMALLVCAGLSGLRSPRLRTVLVAGVVALLCLTLLTTMPARARTGRYLGQFHFERAGTEVVASPDMSPARRAMYDFIRRATPPDAVVIDDPSECQQNTQLLEVPLLARRQLFTAIPNYWMTGGYAECPARMELVRALYGGRPLTSPQRLMLRELNRPVFVLLRPDDPGLQPKAEALIRSRPQEFTEVFSVGGLKLYAMHP
ncbi:hypothetical protein LLH23_19705 [bacterium]|nr:hypothetical protein [bacterium]